MTIYPWTSFKAKREPGYYWVRSPENDWEVAEYFVDEGNGAWFVFNTDGMHVDNEFKEINENRITQ